MTTRATSSSTATKRRDSDGIDLSQAHERNRNGTTRAANRYLNRIRYGNRIPYFPKLAEAQPWPMAPGAIDPDGSKDWFFEVVFDYGEHDLEAPLPDDARQDMEAAVTIRSPPIAPASKCAPTALCQRVLMFHHFPDEQDVGANCLVRSTDFTYSHEQDPGNARNPVYTFLRAVTQTGYRRNNGGYLKRSLPPVEFEYTQPVVQDTVREVDAASLENLPIGLDGSAYQWIDLDGEGIPGILTEQAGAWFYKRNLSPINLNRATACALPRRRSRPSSWWRPKPNVALTRRCCSSWTWPAMASPTSSSSRPDTRSLRARRMTKGGNRSAPSPRA